MAPSIPVRCTLLVITAIFAGIFAGCLSVRKRLAARTERSGGDYRAERRSLTSIALAEYLYYPHANTGNNAARSGFCTRRWLPVVSVLGVVAIKRNLKDRRNAPPISVRCTLFVAGIFAVACQSENTLQQLLSRTRIASPYKYRKRYSFRFLHRRMAVCCICSGNCCNQAKFEYAGRESSNG